MINFDKKDYAKQCPKIKTLIRWHDLPENKVKKLLSSYVY